MQFLFKRVQDYAEDFRQPELKEEEVQEDDINWSELAALSLHYFSQGLSLLFAQVKDYNTAYSPLSSMAKSLHYALQEVSGLDDLNASYRELLLTCYRAKFGNDNAGAFVAAKRARVEHLRDRM